MAKREPTEKQLKRVKHMCYVLGCKEPERTKDAYSAFITRHKDEYIYALEQEFYDEPVEDGW